jgi:membrane associated rhomboid family serine protease
MAYGRGGFQLSIDPVLAIIFSNIVIFVMTSIYGYEAILLFGLQPVVWTQEPYTVLTSMFLHGGILHIFANMITLYFFGSYVLRMVGNIPFLLIFFIGGLLGNLFFILFGDQLAIVVGASGAVFALGGALSVLRPDLRAFIFPIPAPLPIWVAVIGAFVVLSFLPNVAWEAHLGGLIFGAGAGYYLKRQRRYYY